MRGGGGERGEVRAFPARGGSPARASAGGVGGASLTRVLGSAAAAGPLRPPFSQPDGKLCEWLLRLTSVCLTAGPPNLC